MITSSTPPAPRDMSKIARRVDSAAAKFVAESRDGGIPFEPTDENLTAAYANVVKPINPELYPLVRHRIEEIRAELAERRYVTTEPAPLRRALIIRAIEDYSARYASPHNPIVNDPARYVAEGHVTGATGAEWQWIADYIQQHPEVTAAPPLTEQQLRERNRERETRAAELGEQAHEKVIAGDYAAAYDLVDQAALTDPRPARWGKIRDLVDLYAANHANPTHK